MQTDAGHQYGGDRHQGHGVRAGKRGLENGALVLAEQPFDPPQRDGIDIPGVAGNVGDAIDAAVVWGVEAVVHA
jgi:hypothetical protein